MLVITEEQNWHGKPVVVHNLCFKRDFKTLYSYTETEENGRLSSPNWEDPSYVCNWKNYIDEDLKSRWHELSDKERILIYKMAYNEAQKEDWDD